MLMHIPKSRQYFIAGASVPFLFSVFAALWFYIANRYNVLYYHEQIQLFRFDMLYFQSYLAQPGGLAGYMGSFLTQFYAYPVAGAVIIAAILTAVVLLFFRICGNSGRMFFISYIPAVLLMMSFADINFDMSAALGLLIALFAFGWYVLLPLRTRYFAGGALFAALYFVAGGNGLLFSAMVLVFELASGSAKGGGKYVYLLLVTVLSALLPWLAWRTVYTVPLREAYFALTPVNFLFPSGINRALWLSLPALLLFWRMIAGKVDRWRFSPWKSFAANSLLVVFIAAFGAYSAYDRRAEILHRMTFEVQRNNWEAAMALGKAYPTNNRLICYITNIALAESGQIPYRMFHYRQVGAVGLFLDRQLSYFSMWHLGEIYYRLGIYPEAEHGTFEALVLSPKEPNAQTMQRLAITNIVRRDSAAAGKYLGYLGHSLAYRGWARQQRANLALAMADTAFHLPGVPTPYRHDDFFVNYQYPELVLHMLLQSNPEHRLAFEYLMSYWMLQKDLEQMKLCMDRFYGNFDYPAIPVHYEEALIAYKNAIQAGDEFYGRYPVSREARQRFGQYVQAFRAAQGNKRGMEQLEKQFGNTYWFYLHFVEPATLEKKDEKNRY